MSINEFIVRNKVVPADAIVLKKRFFGMVDHFVIYLGIINAQHTFVANYIEGVKIIPNNDLSRFLQELVPAKIDKYPGPENKRHEALKRAISQLGKKAYNYLANNCEHFKNFVHHGIKSSTQVQIAGAAVVIGGVGVTLAGVSKKKMTTSLCLELLLF